MKKLITIGLLFIITGCSHKWCLNKYPPDVTQDTTLTVINQQVPVISPGGHFTFPVFINCDTITDTMTIYQTVYMPPDTQWVTKTDTVWKIKEGKVVTIKEKNPVNKVLLGILIGVGVILVVVLYFIIRIWRKATLRP